MRGKTAKTDYGITKTERILRITVFAVFEVFTLATLLFTIPEGNTERVLINLFTLLLLFIPELVERLLKCKMHTAVYLFGLVYAMGPLFGQCYKLYYITPWWDKFLHISGGVVFSLIGFYFFRLIDKGDGKNLLLGVLFSFFFSVTVSAVWEFYEFGCDSLLGTDMQNDTVITSINSYKLGDLPDSIGRIDDIKEVCIDGTPLEVGGYIDIGIIDTMMDMILESLGALVVSVIMYIDGGRHQLFTPAEEKIPV
ncbi:MAG: hypothetical protein PUA83_03475 [Clostridiales bacterium]|nr:hypothetical protein [Clostridiales bacterium]